MSVDAIANAEHWYHQCQELKQKLKISEEILMKSLGEIVLLKAKISSLEKGDKDNTPSLGEILNTPF